jgi:putative hydrolase of the HAD superfamily
MFDVIAFDADDTLWHNEILYLESQQRLEELLSPYGLDGQVMGTLYETEMRNLSVFGYGTKGFALSMVETAIRLTGGRVTGPEVQEIVNLAKAMLRAPVRLLDNVPEVVATLASAHVLMLITKGDLFDQERKIAQSGLAPYFTYIEVVSHKTKEVYASLLDKHSIAPERFLMVGNSLRSDVLPVLALGGRAVHIPYHITWVHEAETGGDDTAEGYVELARIGQLPQHVERLCRESEERAG